MTKLMLTATSVVCLNPTATPPRPLILPDLVILIGWRACMNHVVIWKGRVMGAGDGERPGFGRIQAAMPATYCANRRVC